MKIRILWKDGMWADCDVSSVQFRMDGGQQWMELYLPSGAKIYTDIEYRQYIEEYFDLDMGLGDIPLEEIERFQVFVDVEIDATSISHAFPISLN